MSVQHERLIELCNELRLGGIAAQYPALAQTAAEKRTSFTDFLEELLVAERESRRARARSVTCVHRWTEVPSTRIESGHRLISGTGRSARLEKSNERARYGN